MYIEHGMELDLYEGCLLEPPGCTLILMTVRPTTIGVGRSRSHRSSLRDVKVDTRSDSSNLRVGLRRVVDGRHCESLGTRAPVLSQYMLGAWWFHVPNTDNLLNQHMLSIF